MNQCSRAIRLAAINEHQRQYGMQHNKRIYVTNMYFIM
jgi:hypothetical protein